MRVLELHIQRTALDPRTTETRVGMFLPLLLPPRVTHCRSLSLYPLSTVDEPETFTMERERGSSSSMMSLTMPPDFKLLPEILEYIGRSGKSAAAYLRFRATCKWLFAALSPHPRHLPLQPPFLMLPLEPDTGLSSFIDITTSRKHNFSQVSDDTRGKCCLGSSFGWLFLTDADFIPFLLNPFTGAQIPLPPLTTIPGFPHNFLPLFATVVQTFAVLSGYRPPSLKVEEMVDMFIYQAVLSADPTLDQQAAIVVVLKSCIGFHSFYCRLGDTSWTEIEISGFPNYHTFDIIPFPERKLCAIINGNSLEVLDFSCPSVKMTVAQLVDFPRCMATYLVESAGELLLITEHHKTTITPYRINKSFRVYKIHLHDLAGDLDGLLQVERVHSIGDRVLFLGPGHSVSIFAQDFPGFRGNCIYYVNACNMYDDTDHVGADFIRVFDLEDCSSEDIFDLSEMDGIAPWRTKATMHWWVSPNLRKGDA